MALDDQDTIKILSVLTVCICLKFYAIILSSGLKRKRAPEDGFQPKAVDEVKQDENGSGSYTLQDRWRRIVQNEMENIPLTVVLMWISVIAGGNNETNVAFAAIFLVARILHNVCYIYSLMPWRSIAWLFGILCTLGFMANIIYGAFK